MPATSLEGFHQTKTAQAFDELARAFADAINTQDSSRFDEVLARNFLSYTFDGALSRTRTKKYFAALRNSFADLHFEVHENIGVLVEDDLIALRTIVTGTHTGDYDGVPTTGRQIQTSVSHFFRVRDDQLSEQWLVMDTYRILARLGAVPGVATAVDALAVGYIQNTGWTPDGRDHFGNAWAIGRGAMPDGLAVHTHVVAENDRVSSLSVWDGTVTASGHQVDFASADFLRIENGVAAEHRDTVDYVRLYQSFGLLPDDL